MSNDGPTTEWRRAKIRFDAADEQLTGRVKLLNAAMKTGPISLVEECRQGVILAYEHFLDCYIDIDYENFFAAWGVTPYRRSQPDPRLAT